MRIVILTLSLILFAVKSFACPFCDPKVLLNQTIYEDDLSVILISFKPMMEGHSLIIPKRHVERYEELTEKEILSIHEMTKKLQSAIEETMGRRSYLLMQKNGTEVGQTVPHIHFHFIPRKENGGSPLTLFFSFLTAGLRPRLTVPEMQQTIAHIQKGFKDPVIQEEQKPIVNETWEQSGI